MKRPPLFIRADASGRIGTGHVMRMLALAHAWMEGGDAPVTFLAASLPDALEGRIRAAGCDVARQPQAPTPHADAEAALARMAAVLPPAHCCLAADGYEFPADFQSIIRRAGCRLLVVDDNGENGSYDCDVILNQNPSAHAGLYARRNASARLMLGTRYALLRPEFLALRDAVRVEPGGPLRLLVTMGGADPADATGLVLDALGTLGRREGRLTVVVGAGNPHAAEVERRAGRLAWDAVDVVRGVADMARLMRNTDLAITAGGSTCWELCLLEVPMIALVIADNQREIVRSLAAAAAAVDAGDARKVSALELARYIGVLLTDAGRRASLASCARALVDGHGARRVRDALLNLEAAA